MRKKIILVTGGAGYLGSVLVGKLLHAGYRVRVLDLLMFGKESLKAFITSPAFELTIGDIRDRRSVTRAMRDVWGVCHLAALVGVPACVVNKKSTREINIGATQLIVQVAKEMHIKKFVYISTCSNYGITDENEIATEKSVLHPISEYAQSKIAAEKIIQDSQIPWTILRLATLYGCSPRMRFNLFISEMVKEAVLHKQIKLYQPDAWRPFVSIDDATRAILMVLKEKENLVHKQIFNVVGQNLRKKEVVEIIKKLDSSLTIIYNNKLDGNSRDYRVSGQKIRRRLGFVPKKTVKQGIIELLKLISNGTYANPALPQFNLWVNEKQL